MKHKQVFILPIISSSSTDKENVKLKHMLPFRALIDIFTVHQSHVITGKTHNRKRYQKMLTLIFHEGYVKKNGLENLDFVRWKKKRWYQINS